MCLAIPGKLLDRDPNDTLCPMGRVLFGSLTKEVCLAYTPEATEGDYVLVHVGFAISVVPKGQAISILTSLGAPHE